MMRKKIRFLLTPVAFLMIPFDRLYLDSPSAYLPEKHTSKQTHKIPSGSCPIPKKVDKRPLKRFRRASVGPPSSERYFPDRMPIAKGLLANKLTLEKNHETSSLMAKILNKYFQTMKCLRECFQRSHRLLHIKWSKKKVSPKGGLLPLFLTFYLSDHEEFNQYTLLQLRNLKFIKIHLITHRKLKTEQTDFVLLAKKEKPSIKRIRSKIIYNAKTKGPRR